MQFKTLHFHMKEKFSVDDGSDLVLAGILTQEESWTKVLQSLFQPDFCDYDLKTYPSPANAILQ